MADASPPPLDAKVIGELRELQDSGSPGLLKELIDVFLRQTEEKFAEIRKAAAAKEADVLARHAHTLKGSGGSLGALHLSSLCKALELAVRANDWAGMRARFSEVEAEFARVRAALLAERDR
jgi:HPt (histidine-containing phosphotransfer) domain-containing protein